MAAARALDLETAVAGRLIQRMLVPLDPKEHTEAPAAEAAIVHVAAAPSGSTQKCICCDGTLQDGAAGGKGSWYPAGRLVTVRGFITQLRPNHLPFLDDERFCERSA